MNVIMILLWATCKNFCAYTERVRDLGVGNLLGGRIEFLLGPRHQRDCEASLRPAPRSRGTNARTVSDQNAHLHGRPRECGCKERERERERAMERLVVALVEEKRDAKMVASGAGAKFARFGGLPTVSLPSF